MYYSKLFLFMLFFWVSFQNGLAQQNYVDSILVEVYKSNDFQKAELLINLSNYTVYNQTPDALKYAEEAYDIAENVKNDSLKFEALRAIGYANGYLGLFEVSLKNMRDGLAYYERIHDSLNMAKALSDVAYLLQALSSSDENIMEYNQRSLLIREKIGDEVGIAYSLNNIGTLYRKWGKHDEAIGYYLKALPYFEKLELKEEIATLNGNIGVYFYDHQNVEKAEYHYSKALQAYREIHHSYGEAKILSNLVKLYLFDNQYEKAISYNLLSKEIRERLNDKEGLSINHFNIGYINKMLGEYALARSHLDTSLNLSREIGLKQMQIKVLETLAEVNALMDIHPIAYQLLLESKALNDSVFSAEKHRQLEEIRAKYDSEKSELENVRLVEENENQRLLLKKNRLLIYLSLGSAILILLIMYLIFQRNKSKEKMHALITEQRLLRSQMNPHFIFNSITAIQSYIFNHSPIEASDYLSAFASLMRQILESSSKEFIVLENEVKMLENYFKLQLQRYSHNFEYRIEIDERIDPTSTIVPPMLNQPFVENAIEHGLKSIDYKGEISIIYRLKNNSIFVEVMDNGIGIMASKKNKNQERESFAIEATKERLMAINNRKRMVSHFEIMDRNKKDTGKTGTLVKYTIPYLTEF